MASSILATKLFVPKPPPNVVLRPRLVERLNAGLHRKLTLISAPAGFGKTTLMSAWVAGCDQRVAWLSLDDGDNDPVRFLIYVVAAIRTIAPEVGEGLLHVLQAAQPPPMKSVLTALINDMATIPHSFVLVIDDYHVLDARAVDASVLFLLEHMPPQMRVVLATREDPQLPLARLRGGGHLSELRITDLRFTPSEAAGFFNQAMGLHLSPADIDTLESRSEGWIAGLQLAALSLHGHPDASSFIQSFSGSHHFVLDYLLEEVLNRQSESVQSFLLRTSILDRLCGPLCDAVLADAVGAGQANLEYLERANLFVVALDNERRWYRYHHLFADLLRQRLAQSNAVQGDLHTRASQWYADHGLELEAFRHAAAANDVERAERLIDGQGVPLQFRGAGGPVLRWLESLPTTVLDARPGLWVTYATALFFVGRHTAVEQKLQAAEAALRHTRPDDMQRDLLGRIASTRATLAIIQHDLDTIVGQSRRALEYLRPDNRPMRIAATYTLGYAYQLQGDRGAARDAFNEVIASGASFGDSIYTIVATLSLGQVQETDTQLVLAATTYQRVLQLAGDPPQSIASEAHLGLARIAYEWNDLEAAERHAQRCVQLTRQIESVDTFASYAVLVARLRLTQGDVPAALAILGEAEVFLRQHHFDFRMPDVAGAQVMALLCQGDVAAAARVAEMHQVPISLARVHLARGDASAALALLEPWRGQTEAHGWADKRLAAMIVQALALHAQGDTARAVPVVLEALALAEPGGFVRSFVDEGAPMAELLTAATAKATPADAVGKVLAAFNAQRDGATQSIVEPLSQRELEVLRLITQGLSNREIGERLFLALDTVKGHNRKIFGKLQVQRRTEAVARARELGLA